MNVGDTRTDYCDVHREVTLQVAKHVQKNGTGKVIAVAWWCVEGEHYVGREPEAKAS